MDTIFITGVGEAQGAASKSLEGLIFEAATRALADGGLSRDELDGVALAASDQVDGRAISSMLTSGPAGAYLNEEINIASSPGHALALACLQVASGTHRRILVSSWGKASESLGGHTEAAERLSAEPFFERDGGISRVAAAALQAQALRAAHGERAELAAATVAARNHGAKVSVADVLASPPVALPLRRLEWPQETDAAFAILVEDGSRAVGHAVEVAGYGWCADSSRIAERDLVGLPHLAVAAQGAYRSAGIDDPLTAIDAWQLHDTTPDAEIAAYAPLGLCAPDAAIELALAGNPGKPVNAGGGSVRGEAPFGGPIGKVTRAVGHVRDGLAGRAVAQIGSGFAGQFQSVFVLGDRA